MYISYKNINYDIINSFIAKNHLLGKIKYNYYSIAMYYILDHTLEKYFYAKLKAQKHIKGEKLLFKYFN